MRSTAFALLLLPACSSPGTRSRLPSLLQTVVRLQDHGGYASLLVELGEPREQPHLRVARGFLDLDPPHLEEGLVLPVDLPTGAGVELRFIDLATGEDIGVQLGPTRGSEPGDAEPGPARGEVFRLVDRSAVLRAAGPGWERWVELDLDTGELREVQPPKAPQRFLHYGPGRGFALLVQDSELHLQLPFSQPGGWTLLRRVEAIVSLHWLDEGELGGTLGELVDRRFKAAGLLGAQARPCRPDGDLSEWKRDVALSVASAAYVQSGLDAWSGPRDASFALAARLTPTSLCLGMRVRDDHLLPGRDRVIFQFSERSWELPVPSSAAAVPLEGGPTAHFVEKVSFGTGLELCFPPEHWTVEDGRVYFRALYVDEDPGESPTTLATAPDVPWPEVAGIRLPRRGRSGLPPRPPPSGL